jgi:hypothetical protein
VARLGTSACPKPDPSRDLRRLVADYHLDGLKIDFIDQWSSHPSTPTPTAADTSSYAVGVDRLLAQS